MLTLDEDTTDNTFDSTLCSRILDTEVDKDVRVFPIFFTIVDTELDNEVKVFGINFTIVETDVDKMFIVLDIARRIVTFETTVYEMAIK